MEISLPIIPFSEIDKAGAGMYKGKKISLAERQSLNSVSDKVDSNFTSDLESHCATITPLSHSTNIDNK